MNGEKPCGPGAKVVRWSMLILGTVALTLGLIGIFVPVLPTTPFLLLTAACYARSSQRFYRWLITNRLFGAYICSYREGRGLSVKVRAFTISMLWLTISPTVIIFVDRAWIKVLLLAIATVITVHVGLLRPKEPHE